MKNVYKDFSVIKFRDIKSHLIELLKFKVEENNCLDCRVETRKIILWKKCLKKKYLHIKYAFIELDPSEFFTVF